MNTPVKILLLILLLGGLAIGIGLMMDAEDDYTPGPGDTDPTKIEKAGQPSKELDGSDTTPEDRREKTPAVRKELTKDNTGKKHAQGVFGRVVDESSYPIPGCDVYLMPGTGSIDVLQMMRQRDQGRRFLPVAQGRTDQFGKFVLGVAKIEEGRKYDLRVLHPKFCDFKMAGLVIQANDRFDTKDIRMKRGITVLGRVTVQGQNLPVSEAVITVDTPHGQVDVAPPPGRENGMSVNVDEYGNYRMENVDPEGFYRVYAWAPGFAKVERTEVQLDPNKENRIDFELPVGHKIVGMVTGPQGKPVPSAKISAYALSQKTSQNVEARADDEGRFELKGLHQGAFTVIAKAEGYIERKVAPVPSGKTDLVLTLETQGKVSVQVFSKKGRPLSNYDVILKTYVPAQSGGDEFYGNAGISKNVRGARDGKSTLTGINPMDYVLEVHAPDHAKAFSDPFKIVDGDQQVPSVVVRLNEGGVIVGKLTDARGKPVKGATVATLPKGFFENPLTKMFQIPFKITKKAVSTDEKGQFRISMLNEGTYQLKITSRRFCTHRVDEVVVVTGQEATVPVVQLDRGAEISGTTRVDGTLKGQVKVTISSVGGAAGAMPISYEAVSNNLGMFAVPKRLPPGRYEARAGEQIQGNPFILMFQMQKSKRDFTIGRGQEKYRLDMNIESAK